MNKTPTQPEPILRPFDPHAFRRQLTRAAIVHRVAVGFTFAALAAVLLLPLLFLPETQQAPIALLAMFLIPAIWLPITLTTQRVARTLPQIGAAITTDPERAERLIADALKRKPVMAWGRLLTYHRLAALRHQQHNFDETADICQNILSQPLTGPAAAARPSLLLMLTEAHLARGNLVGAYHTLSELHRTRLGLAGAMQRLALQTRYALKAGAYEHALDHGREKMQLAELMPPPQCGAMHAMLADAAKKTGRDKLASWLWERAKLISPPHLLDQLQQGAFDVDVVAADETTQDVSA
ncbi:hypothetical protein OT109_07955 [Phycisphaeraceae bacterium D3-23]